MSAVHGSLQRFSRSSRVWIGRYRVDVSIGEILHVIEFETFFYQL